VPAPQQPLPTSPTATASTSNGTLKAAASSAVSG
jgi:hypothetical protein